MFTQTKTKRGFTLVETLFYIAGVILLLGVIVMTLINTYELYRYNVIYPRYNQEGVLAASRIENDIRSGVSLITAQKVFNTASGAIGINATDTSGNAVTYYYALQNGRIIYNKNGGANQFISPSNLTVTTLQFNEINTPLSVAIRFAIDISYSTKAGTTTHSYTSLGILRNSY